MLFWRGLTKKFLTFNVNQSQIRKFCGEVSFARGQWLGMEVTHGHGIFQFVENSFGFGAPIAAVKIEYGFPWRLRIHQNYEWGIFLKSLSLKFCFKYPKKKLF